MPDIFISYAHEDADPFLTDLFEYLRIEGFDADFDRGLIPGHDFPLWIEDQIFKARATLVIWSENSIKSDFVKHEATTAWNQNKYVPLYVPGFDVNKIPTPYQKDRIFAAAISEVERIKAALLDKRCIRKPPERNITSQVLTFGQTVPQALILQPPRIGFGWLGRISGAFSRKNAIEPSNPLAGLLKEPLNSPSNMAHSCH